jgi:hypothetical protein
MLDTLSVSVGNPLQFQLIGQVTGDPMVVLQLTPFGNFLFTDILRIAAAGMEFAAGRRISRAGYVSFE